MTTAVRIGLSTSDAAGCDFTLNLPGHSPVTHGMLRIDAQLDGHTILSATPVLGGMHRGAEKLFESRDYRQILSLANRHDWLSSFTGELGVARLVERELGIAVPEHAAWLRLLLCEIHRVLSLTAFLGGYPWTQDSTGAALRSLRQQWVEVTAQYTGTRMHTMITVYGGVSHEPSAEWLTAVAHLCTLHRDAVTKTKAAVTETPLGLGVVNASTVMSRAITGPASRAAGVHYDWRATMPELPYAGFSDLPIVTDAGDVAGRLTQMCAEVEYALDVIGVAAQKCQELAGSPVNTLLPKVIRVPEGEFDSRMETPMGTALWFLVSFGDKMPQRLALRPASLNTVLALSIALAGAELEDAPAIVASLPFLTGDAER